MSESIIKNFKGKKILVVGDVILDLYIRGKVERISPEAPVPVVYEEKRDYVLGGAGNVAANVASLGGGATIVGVVGGDVEGKIVRRLCRRAGIATRFISERGRPTSLKTRAVAARHQLARIDREDAAPVSRVSERKITSLIKNLGWHDVVVVSDYAKGCLSKKVVEAIKNNFDKKNIFAGIKPQNGDLYSGVGAAVLNLKEAETITGIGSDGDESASRAAKKLSALFNASVVLTRGEHGMTVYEKKSGKTFHTPARALQVYDVTGAGDTALATLALAFSAGAELSVAADIANRAAGVVVGREGTVTVKPVELREAGKGT